MNILIVSQHYYPEQFQINEIAPALVKRGHLVTVVCGLPDYPQGKVYPGYKDKSKRDEWIEGVHVIRCWQFPRGKNVVSLIMNYMTFPWYAKKAIAGLDDKFDVVFSYQLSPITMVMPAVAYRNAHHLPLLLYCLDQWPVSVRGHVGSEKNVLYRYAAKLSKKMYQQCDRILVTSSPFIDYLHIVNNVDKYKMGYLPQHADASMLEMDLSKQPNGRVVFMYAGNLGDGQWVDVIIKAAVEMERRDDYEIHIVGDGSKRKELQELAQRLEVSDRILFLGNHTRSEMPSIYKQADVLLITLRGNNEVGNTMPGKLQMYMTTGKPILGAINGATQEVLSEAKCGKCVQAGDYKGLAQLMVNYLEHREDYDKCGKNAQEYFRNNFTLDIFLDRLEGEFKALIG